MPRSIPALVTPALLKWARERAGLKLEAAGDRSGFHPTTLEEWEAGNEVPTIAQARKLGSAKGIFIVPKDFNAPLPKNIEDSFRK